MAAAVYRKAGASCGVAINNFSSARKAETILVCCHCSAGARWGLERTPSSISSASGTQPGGQALNVLDKEQVPVTVAGVARKAHLSRQTVYNSPFIGKIQEAARKTSVAQRSEMRAQMTDKSKDHRYKEVMEQNRKLRDKVTELKKQIDVLLLQMRSK
jgi:hypothetical protein